MAQWALHCVTGRRPRVHARAGGTSGTRDIPFTVGWSGRNTPRCIEFGESLLWPALVVLQQTMILTANDILRSIWQLFIAAHPKHSLGKQEALATPSTPQPSPAP